MANGFATDWKHFQQQQPYGAYPNQFYGADLQQLLQLQHAPAYSPAAHHPASLGYTPPTPMGNIGERSNFGSAVAVGVGNHAVNRNVSSEMGEAVSKTPVSKTPVSKTPISKTPVSKTTNTPVAKAVKKKTATKKVAKKNKISPPQEDSNVTDSHVVTLEEDLLTDSDEEEPKDDDDDEPVDDVDDEKTARGMYFKPSEVTFLLDICEKKKPVAGEAIWNVIEQVYNKKFFTAKRSWKSLRGKYKALYNTKAPTGDPDCPSAVKRAKHIRYKTIKHAGAITEADLDDASIANGTGMPSSAKKRKTLVERREPSGGNDFKEIMLLHQKMQQERHEKQREDDARLAKEERTLESARQDRRSREMTELVGAVVGPLVGLFDKFISPVATKADDSSDGSLVVTRRSRGKQKASARRRAQERWARKQSKAIGHKRPYLDLEMTDSDDSAQLPRQSFDEYKFDEEGAAKRKDPAKGKDGSVAAAKGRSCLSVEQGKRTIWTPLWDGKDPVYDHVAIHKERRAAVRKFKLAQLAKNKSIRDVLRARKVSREPGILDEIKTRQEEALAGEGSDYAGDWHSDMDEEEKTTCKEVVARKVRQEMKEHSVADWDEAYGHMGYKDTSDVSEVEVHSADGKVAADVDTVDGDDDSDSESADTAALVKIICGTAQPGASPQKV
jgi:hypothetical protein